MFAMDGSGHSQIFMMLGLFRNCILLRCIELPVVFPKLWAVRFQTILHQTRDLCLPPLELPLLAGCLGNLVSVPVLDVILIKTLLGY